MAELIIFFHNQTMKENPMPLRKKKTYSATDRRRHLEDQPNSGHTIADYCRKHEISISTFNNWKLRDRNSNSTLFVEFPVLIPAAEEQLTVTCGLFTLAVPFRINEEYLATVLSALNRASR
jgi:hypothetical protein